METPLNNTAAFFIQSWEWCFSVVLCTPEGTLSQRLNIWGGSDFAVFSDFRLLFAYVPWNTLWMGPKPKHKIHFFVCYILLISTACMKFDTVFLVQQHFKCGLFHHVTMSIFKVLIWKHFGLRLRMFPCLILLSKMSSWWSVSQQLLNTCCVQGKTWHSDNTMTKPQS